MSENKELLGQRLDMLNMDYPPEAPRLLATYHELLADWNERVNLTGDASFAVMLDRHYMDSVAPLAQAKLFPRNASLIDVGSGAGLPGLPLAILRPDLRVTLLDSLGKRVKFLDEVVRVLQLHNVRTLHARAEDAARDVRLREQFEIATARAVAATPVLLEYLLPFVKVGGKAICYKGPSEELAAGDRAAALLGGSPLQALDTPVPAQPDWRHCVLVSEKTQRTARQYPRKAGTPTKEPLGAIAVF